MQKSTKVSAENDPVGVFNRFYDAIKDKSLRYRHYYECGFLEKLFNKMELTDRKAHQFKYVQACNWCKNSDVYDARIPNYGGKAKKKNITSKLS